jgi:hypothetical protein
MNKKISKGIPDDLITLNEAAELREYADVSGMTRLINRGHIRVYELYGRKLVSRADVLAYVPSKGGRPPKTKDEKASGSDEKVVVKKASKKGGKK